jgi:hypothetical protein
MTIAFAAGAAILGIGCAIGHSLISERKFLQPLYAKPGTGLFASRSMCDITRMVFHIPSIAWAVLGFAVLVAHRGRQPTAQHRRGDHLRRVGAGQPHRAPPPAYRRPHDTEGFAFVIAVTAIEIAGMPTMLWWYSIVAGQASPANTGELR